jgi:hypothetical protein
VVCHGTNVEKFALNWGLNKRLCYTCQRKNPDVITTQCFLHQEVLVSKTIGEDLKQDLGVAVNTITFIKQCILSQACL